MKRKPTALRLAQDNGQPSGRLSKPATDGTSIRHTDRDTEIISALVHRIRCLDAKLASRWWEDSMEGRRAASRRLAILVKAGWLAAFRTFARPLIEFRSPITSWRVGDIEPDFGPISYCLKTRFRSPAKATTVFVATKQAAKHFGGSGDRRPRASEVTHDLGLASVFINLFMSRVLVPSSWISEARIIADGTEKGVKVPDALVRTSNGETIAIEFGGEYGKTKLRAFHRYCASREMGYDLW